MRKYIQRAIIILMICMMFATVAFSANADYDNMMSREEAVEMQKKAHAMANIARELGYPENDYIIVEAKERWHEAQEVIDWYDSSIERLCFEFFKEEMGLSEAAICGILANISSESGFDYTVDIHWGYGLVGWCGDRRVAVHETMKEYDSPLVGQLRHIQKELEGSYSHVLEKLNNVSNDASGAYEAGHIFCLEYEIPVDMHSKAVYRGKLARETYWEKYRPYK